MLCRRPRNLLTRRLVVILSGICRRGEFRGREPPDGSASSGQQTAVGATCARYLDGRQCRGSQTSTSNITGLPGVWQGKTGRGNDPEEGRRSGILENRSSAGGKELLALRFRTFEWRFPGIEQFVPNSQLFDDTADNVAGFAQSFVSRAEIMPGR